MTDYFPALWERMKGIEKEFSNVKGDPGGRTVWGISERWNPDLFKDGIPSEEKCRERARKNYWNSVGCDKVPDIYLAWELFDCSYNLGPGKTKLLVEKAVKVLPQTLFSKVAPTWPNVLKVIGFKESLCRALAALVNHCQVQYYIDQNNPQFLVGWLAKRGLTMDPETYGGKLDT